MRGMGESEGAPGRFKQGDGRGKETSEEVSKQRCTTNSKVADADMDKRRQGAWTEM